MAIQELNMQEIDHVSGGALNLGGLLSPVMGLLNPILNLATGLLGSLLGVATGLLGGLLG